MIKIKTILLIILLAPFTIKSQNTLKEDTAVPLLGNDKWGWADLFSNKTLIDPIYDKVDYNDELGFLVFLKDKIGVVECITTTKCIVNFSDKNLEKIKTKKTKLLIDPNLPTLSRVKQDDIILNSNHDFNYGNRYREEKFNIGSINLVNSNQYFDEYLIVKNQDESKLGIINIYKDSIILKPEYDDIRILKRIHDNFVIAQKGVKLTLLFNGRIISENRYDEIVYNETQDIMILKKDNLYGFVLFQNKNTFHPEVAYTDKNSFVIFEPKYVSFKNSKYSSGYLSTSVLNVIDINNKNHYISNLGFEYVQ